VVHEKEEIDDTRQRLIQFKAYVVEGKRNHCRGPGTGGSSGYVARRGWVCLGDKSSRRRLVISLANDEDRRSR
jgi:hypothetical protein